MYFYRHNGKAYCSLDPLPLTPSSEPAEGEELVFLSRRPPETSRLSFRVTDPRELAAPEGTEFLDCSRLPPPPELTEGAAARIAAGRLRSVNFSRPDWESAGGELRPGKLRLNILAVGDVGSTLLMGLKLLGGDVLEKIGICDLDPRTTARWEFEMGQVTYPWDYGALPEVDIVPPERLFDCGVLVFAATKRVPPVGEGGDVRMAQFGANSGIAAAFARKAREARFGGLFAVMSDPVDPLAKTVFLESNRGADGRLDFRGLPPERIQGYGLGVMNARAAYFAKRDPRYARFLTEGRSFGPHGEDLVVADSIEHYDPAASEELTRLAVTANLKMREMGFKPYAAPALSSGAISLLQTVRGEWHCGSVYLGGAYVGVRSRYTPFGQETEDLRMPDALYGRIKKAADNLRKIV